jgi:hypothetical protein
VLADRLFEEIRHCWQLGASASDRATLALDTLRSHFLGSTEKPAPDLGHRRIRLPEYPETGVEFYYRRGAADLRDFHDAIIDHHYWIPPILTNVVKCVVDLGAKTGASTLAFAAQFPQASFVCVEEDPSRVEVLRKNLAWLGKRAHVAQLDEREPDGGLGEILDASGFAQVDILKVDLGGAERTLFASRGAWWSRIRLVAAKLHEPYGFVDFERDMEALNFRAVAGGLGFGNVLPVGIRP